MPGVPRHGHYPRLPGDLVGEETNLLPDARDHRQQEHPPGRGPAVVVRDSLIGAQTVNVYISGADFTSQNSASLSSWMTPR
ncbi:hypothetical protein ACFFX0_20480 [Citricoccus parietis]|uniref:Uncharacterized protein n=1 Tax=Citricoccus parietis TaxID=592307 RepID=A0ABV5G3D3_9MICC